MLLYCSLIWQKDENHVVVMAREEGGSVSANTPFRFTDRSLIVARLPPINHEVLTSRSNRTIVLRTTDKYMVQHDVGLCSRLQRLLLLLLCIFCSSSVTWCSYTVCSMKSILFVMRFITNKHMMK